MNKDKNHDDVVTFLMSVIMAFVIICTGVILSKVLWPAICYIAKKTLMFVRAQKNKPKTEKPKTAVIELHTPEIFKGASNLAQAKEFRLN